MGKTQINLIRSEGGRAAGILKFEDIFRKVAWISVSIVCLLSVIVGITFISLTASLRASEAKNIQLTQSIEQQSAKEGLIISLIDRTAIASKALSAAKPWGKLFTLLTRLAPENVYNTISIDETMVVTTTMELMSLDEAVQIASNTIAMATERVLRMPQLQSFSLRDDGTIQMSVSFFPVL